MFDFDWNYCRLLFMNRLKIDMFEMEFDYFGYNICINGQTRSECLVQCNRFFLGVWSLNHLMKFYCFGLFTHSSCFLWYEYIFLKYEYQCWLSLCLLKCIWNLIKKNIIRYFLQSRYWIPDAHESLDICIKSPSLSWIFKFFFSSKFSL